LLSILREMDTNLFWFINTRMTTPGLDPLMQTLSSAWLWWICAGFLAVGAFKKKNSHLLKTLLLVGLAMGVTDLVAFELVKPTVGRERPCRDLEGVRLVSNKCGGDYGFPSNHAANGFAAATVFWVRRPREEHSAWAMVALPFAVALVVGFTRVYLGVHFPLDILAGFTLGFCVAYGGVWMLKRWPAAKRYFWPASV